MRKAVVFFGFCLLAALWFFKEAFGGFLFCFGDLTNYFYPYRWFLARSVRLGGLPLWNPYIQLGFPFLATLQTGAFYPLSVLYYIFPFDPAFNWFLIVHYPLGGFFMYLLARELKQSVPAAAGAGLVFAFSGYLSSVLHMPTTLAAVIWLPLVFLFWRRLVNGLGNQRLNVALTGCLLALMFLGGEPTVLYGTVCSLVVYLGYRRFGDWWGMAVGVLFLAAGLAIAAGLTAVQLLPFAELLLHSVRAGGLPYAEAARYSIPLNKMIDLVFPYFSSVRWYPWLDNGWLKNTYLGIVPAGLAVTALVHLPARQRWWLAGSLLFILLVMAGPGSPLPVHSLLFTALPGFKLFRYPAKFMFLLVFIIAYLAGRGIDLLTENVARLRRSWIAWLAVAAAGSVFLWGVLEPQQFYAALRLLFSTEVAPSEEPLVRSLILSRDLPTLGRLAGLCAIMLCWLAAARRWNWRPIVIKIGLVVLILADLYTANSGANFSFPAKAYQAVPGNVGLLKRDQSEFRYFLAPDAYQKSYYDDAREFADWGRELASLRNRLTYDQNMLFGLPALDGYESIKGTDQGRIMGKLLSLNSLSGVRALDLFNVKYLVSASPFRQAGYRLLTVTPEAFKGGNIYLYENQNVLPRSFYVPQAITVASREAALERIFSRGFDPRRAVLLEEQVSAPHGLWFTSEWYYPGWKAFVDGREAKVYRADFMFRAVVLPRPDSKVTYRYDPLSFKLGAVFSLVSLLALAALLLPRRR